MERRDCVKVIEEMLLHIPNDQTELIEDLEWNKNDASYKAPEDNLQWLRTGETLEKHILKPTEEWEWKIISIFSTIPIDDLKLQIDNEPFNN